MNGMIQKKIISKNVDAMKKVNNQFVSFINRHCVKFDEEFDTSTMNDFDTLKLHLQNMNVFFDELLKKVR